MTQFVTNDVIATDAVNATSIAAGAVGAAELATDAVTTVKILNANVTPAKLSQPLTLDTVQTTTSGTLKDFNIPAWARRIRVLLNGVSLSGTSLIRFRLGTSGGVATSGYLGAGSVIAATAATASQTAGFDIYNSAPAAAELYSGAMDISLLDAAANIWVVHGVFTQTAVARTFTTAGQITLAGALTFVRVTTLNGTDTFDAGSVNVIYD